MLFLGPCFLPQQERRLYCLKLTQKFWGVCAHEHASMSQYLSAGQPEINPHHIHHTSGEAQKRGHLKRPRLMHELCLWIMSTCYLFCHVCPCSSLWSRELRVSLGTDGAFYTWLLIIVLFKESIALSDEIPFVLRLKCSVWGLTGCMALTPQTNKHHFSLEPFRL